MPKWVGDFVLVFVRSGCVGLAAVVSPVDLVSHVPAIAWTPLWLVGRGVIARGTTKPIPELLPICSVSPLSVVDSGRMVIYVDKRAVTECEDDANRVDRRRTSGVVRVGAECLIDGKSEVRLSEGNHPSPIAMNNALAAKANKLIPTDRLTLENCLFMSLSELKASGPQSRPRYAAAARRNSGSLVQRSETPRWSRRPDIRQ